MITLAALLSIAGLAVSLQTSSAPELAWLPVLRCSVGEYSALYTSRGEKAKPTIVVGYRELSPGEPEVAVGRPFQVIYSFDETAHAFRLQRALQRDFDEDTYETESFLARIERAVRSSESQWSISAEGGHVDLRIVAKRMPGPEIPLMPQSLVLLSADRRSSLILGEEYFNPQLEGAEYLDFDGDGHSEVVFVISFYRGREIVVLAQSGLPWNRADCPSFNSLQEALLAVSK